MATHTSAVLNIDEAKSVADLAGVASDFMFASRYAELLCSEYEADKPKWDFIESLSIAAVVIYSRPFTSGVRNWSKREALEHLNEAQRENHEWLRAYRDKHVAHSVNPYEENTASAGYCVERVEVEGITSISCSSGRVLSISPERAVSIIENVKVFQALVGEQSSAAKKQLLEHVRTLPLEQVISGGLPTFAPDTNSNVDRRRP